MVFALANSLSSLLRVISITILSRSAHSAPLSRGVRRLGEIGGAENEHTEGARKGYFVFNEKCVH
jgi:DNA-binding transcriptional regulator GbsR (MarR family)